MTMQSCSRTGSHARLLSRVTLSAAPFALAGSTWAQCPPIVSPGAGFTGLRSTMSSTPGIGIAAATTWDPDGIGPHRPLLVAGTHGLSVSADHDLHDLSAWDGESWSPLGASFYASNPAKDMVTFQGKLVVLGSWFYTGDGGPFQLADYDGSQWRDIGGHAMTRADRVFASRDNLFISGRQIAIGAEQFEIVRWDGLELSGFAADVWTAPTTVRAVCEFQDGVYVAGHRPASDPMPRATLTVTTSDVSSVVGGGLNGPVNYLLEFDGALIVVGEFTEAGGSAYPGIAAWDGDQWSSISPPVQGADVRAVGVVGSALHVATRATDDTAASIYQFKDGVWTLSLAVTVPGSSAGFHHILEYEAVPVATGDIARLNGIFACHAITPRNGSWGALDPGTDASINRICRVGGDLFVAGACRQLDGVLVDCVARRAVSGWEPLPPLTNGTGAVLDAVEWRGQLVVAGDYDNTHSPHLASIAVWDGVAWGPVGLDFPFDRALALEVNNDELFVGVRSGVGHLVNDEWTCISEPTESTSSFPVRALAMHDDDLIAAGTFTKIGGVSANSVARWDGVQWHCMGDGVDGFIRSLAVFEGRLFAAGVFSLPNSPGANIAEWDGKQWIAHQGLPLTWMESVFPLGDRLVASGVFSEIGGKPISNLAVFDGISWLPMAEMEDVSFVRDGYSEGNQAILVGSFASIGNVTSAYIAEMVLACSADYICDGIVDTNDLTSFLNDFAACEQQPAPCGSAGNADVNADTIIDILDLLDYLDAYATPCE